MAKPFDVVALTLWLSSTVEYLFRCPNCLKMSLPDIHKQHSSHNYPVARQLCAILCIKTYLDSSEILNLYGQFLKQFVKPQSRASFTFHTSHYIRFSSLALQTVNGGFSLRPIHDKVNIVAGWGGGGGWPSLHLACKGGQTLIDLFPSFFFFMSDKHEVLLDCSIGEWTR